MSSDSAWNLLVFRDAKTALSGRTLLNGLVYQLSCPTFDRTRLVDLLLRAGEWECVLEDRQLRSSANRVTDAFADALVSGIQPDIRALTRLLQGMPVPEKVEVSPPEGFAYYALHPLDYADLVQRLNPQTALAAVIGIRSIGTALGAVVKARLQKQGIRADRISVRPHGHPYDRCTQLTSSQQLWVTTMLAQGAKFFVVDEGPGISGSSFLSVGEALVRTGVPEGQIVFLGSRRVEPDKLTAPSARERWVRFHSFHTEGGRYLPTDADANVSGGAWRQFVFRKQEEWPSSWVTLERQKYLSADRSRIFKFEGFGRFGTEANERAVQAADAGFGPRPFGMCEGFGAYPMIQGRTLLPSDVSADVLEQLAKYCVLRREISANSEVDSSELERMLRHNVATEFGLDLPRDLELDMVHPVIADGRMLPHKWLNADGKFFKVDNACHGDDHFFPGPVDIAWDLAGTVVEWGVDNSGTDLLLRLYRRESGDDATGRVHAYLLAYAVFRMAFCKMAAASVACTLERDRLLRDYQRYRLKAESLFSLLC